MENNAVGLIHLDLLAVHDKQSLVEIHREEGHRIGLMIEGYQMPVIGEQGGILGIFAADRQAQYLCQISVVRIYAENNNGIVAGI